MRRDLIACGDHYALPEGMDVYDCYKVIIALADRMGLCVVRVVDGKRVDYEVMTKEEYVGQPDAAPES